MNYRHTASNPPTSDHQPWPHLAVKVGRAHTLDRAICAYYDDGETVDEVSGPDLDLVGKVVPLTASHEEAKW